MAEKVSRDRGYRSDSIAVLRDMGPLRFLTRMSLLNPRVRTNFLGVFPGLDFGP